MQYEDALATWQSWKVESKESINLRLDSFRILFAYNSGKIENDSVTYHDTREIFENGKIVGYTGDTRTLFELQNQKTCYDFLLDKIAAKEAISVELIKSIHRVLSEGTYDEHRYIDNGERPGEFKRHDYVTGINEVGSKPEDVESDIQTLVNELNASGHANPLVAGAYLHACFENIHPFADGNGRVGRNLLNYWLMINNYPPVIVYEDDRREYYQALQIFDEQEDLNPLIDFLKKETVRTWARAMDPESCKMHENITLKNYL